MKADICLILEGTYPYVHGGVSSWIHELVSAMQEFTFSIIHISATGDVMHVPKYDIPPNIIEFKEAFIHDFSDDKSKTFGNKSDGWNTLREYYSQLESDVLPDPEKFYRMIIDKTSRRLNIHDIMFTRDGWNMLLEFYNSIAPDVSFIDFYWTMRFIHIPILNIFNVDLPEASIYHTVCTGYAGLLASIAKISRKSPLILTEHGIYTHERKIDISRSGWIYSETDQEMRATRTLGFFKDLWIKKFEILSKLTYENADRIITLFEGNRRLQIEGGADPAKSVIIPNGVYFQEKEVIKKEEGVKTIGFVGRVVPIKDVKMLIRAAKIVKEKIPNIRVYIMGDRDEDPDYAEECSVLVKMLQLEDNVVFTDVVDVDEYYPILDVMVLTSISEAQPLSMLEAMSFGIPIVATNVGSCRELIIGKTSQDQALGKAGIVTKVGDPHETGRAIIKVLEDETLREEIRKTGIERVKRYYTVKDMIESYRSIYMSFLEDWKAK